MADEPLETDEDVGIVASPSPAASTPMAVTAEPPPAAGAEGRQVVVRPRAPPKPPPVPPAPHPSVPVSVQPQVAAPGFESDEDVGITPQPGLAADIGKSVWGGLAEGTEGLLGAPHDIPHAADYGLDWAAAHLSHAMFGTDPEQAIKQTRGSILRTLGQGRLVDAFSLPGAADYQRWFQKAGIDPGYTPQSIGGRYAKSIASFVPMALPGGVAGTLGRVGSIVAPAVGSEALGHLTEGTKLEPWARFAGAGLGALAHSGAAAATTPLRESGQRDLAAADLRRAATDPDAALAKARAAQAQAGPGMAPGENIPGSRPTTSQVTLDPGLVGAERDYQKDFGVPHSQRMGEQQAAQTRALQGVQPSGAPETVADMITKRLRDIDQQHEAELEMRRGIHEATQQNIAEQARREAGAIAKRGEPEALGEAARQPFAESMAKRKAQEKRLWEAIQADKIGVWTPQIAARARDIGRRIGKQKPPEGEEAAILAEAANLPRWTRLSDVTDLTSRLKAAMRQERFTNGSTPALKRMATLLKTKENVIKAAATRQSAKEAATEMEGLRRMTPQDRAQIMAARAATKERGEIERGPAGGVIRQGATSGDYRTLPSQVPGKVFASGPTGYQKAKAYAEATGKPWLDPFVDIVSDSLAREATTDGMVDAGKLARWQSKYSDALRALPDEVRSRFVGGPGEAGAAMAEGAAQRREALIAHSKIDIAKQLGKQAPAAALLRSNPAFKKFEGADNARDVQNIVGGMLTGQNAVKNMRQLSRYLARTPAADGLKRAVLDHMIEKVTSAAPVAGASGEAALLVGKTKAFIAKNKEALKAAGLSDQQLGTLDKISADMERQQSLYTTKVPVGSDTGQNLSKVLKKIAEKSHSNAGWLAPLLAGKEIYERLPEAFHGPMGIAAAAAAYPIIRAYNAARHKGLQKATDLYHDAVMNPDTAVDLLSRPSPGSHARLAQKYGRQAMYATGAAQRAETLRH